MIYLKDSYIKEFQTPIKLVEEDKIIVQPFLTMWQEDRLV